MKLMKCGCAAQGSIRAKDGSKVEACVLHSCTEEHAPVSLIGRKAKCSLGHAGEVDSDVHLAFFKYQPNEQYDSYYCDCRKRE